MPTFDTPQPITVTIEIGVGDIRIVASDRADTIVEVRPSDSAKESDVTAAEQTRVEYADGRLLIKASKRWRQYTSWGGGESVDVQIALPEGSHVRGEAGLAALQCAGRLGDCRLKTGIGEIRLDQASLAQLSTGGGDITVDRVLDHAELKTGSGSIEVGRIGGTAVVRNSNGDTWIGEVTGELRVKAANGRISLDQAHSGVAAKTANGDIRLGEVSRGAILAQTACGKVDIGILDGVAAWLDLSTQCGTVQNDLDAAQSSEPGDETVEVRARTSFGDITIRRSSRFANHPGTDEA
jgi:DUF4097 and DUF4098 domain-containing protein YvlB